MLVGGHGQHLDRPVGVLEQTTAMVCHRQVLLNGSQPLQGLKTDDHLVAWCGDPKTLHTLCNRYDLLLTRVPLGSDSIA
jgi:hypothetical protein